MPNPAEVMRPAAAVGAAAYGLLAGAATAVFDYAGQDPEVEI
ncbi:MAG TPA: hypothetical protein VMF65_18450 [Acidimicrobiales bacterium]|nr:hypothetical protein [Acidimicrobiales bacterium]